MKDECDTRTELDASNQARCVIRVLDISIKESSMTTDESLRSMLIERSNMLEA